MNVRDVILTFLLTSKQLNAIFLCKILESIHNNNFVDISFGAQVSMPNTIHVIQYENL